MGSTREDRLRQTTCPNCQRLSLVLAAFCSGCGSRLKSVTVPSRQAEHPLLDEPTQWVERWRSAAPATSVAPVLYRNLLVTVGRDGTLECRSPASPEPLWDLKLPARGAACPGGPRADRESSLCAGRIFHVYRRSGRPHAGY
jgi:hypothetical protein